MKWAGASGSVSGFYRMLIAAAFFALPFGLEVRRRPIRSARAIGLGEWPTPLDVLGGALALAGVWIVNRYGKTKSKDFIERW